MSQLYFPRGVVQPLDNAPHPKLVLLSGKPTRADIDAAPVGCWDEIRKDVRRLSTVQPVERVFLQRDTMGYSGVLYSQNKPYLFVMDSTGFAVKPTEDTSEVMQLCARLEEREQKLTQENREKLDVELLLPQDKVDGVREAGLVFEQAYDATAPEMDRASTGPKRDVIERVPGVFLNVINTRANTSEAAGGVIVHHGKVLIVKPTNGYGGYDWTFPKGYLKGDERNQADGAKRCAEREVNEETGFSAVARKHLGRVRHNDGGVCDYYLMELLVPPDENYDIGDGEVEDTKWVTITRAKELLNDDKDIEVLGLVMQATPDLIIKAQQEVKQPGKRGGKWWRDEHGHVRYDARPKSKQPKTPAVNISDDLRERIKAKRAVKIGVKPVQRVTAKNTMGIEFFRNMSKHNPDDFETRAGKDRYPTITDSMGFTEGEVDWLFKQLHTSRHKNMDAFLKDVLKPMWDDEGPDGPYTEDNARRYMERVLKYLEQDGAIAHGGRDLLFKKKGVNWQGMKKHLPRIVTSSTAQKYVRESMRTLLEDYGARCKDTDAKHKDTIKIDGHLGRTRNAAAYHRWDGYVALKIEVHQEACKFVDAMNAGKPVTKYQASSFAALVHEEFHGASSMEQPAYQGPGVIVEEVATEVAARVVMRDKLGHVMTADTNLKPLRDVPEFQVTSRGPYGKYIQYVLDALVHEVLMEPLPVVSSTKPPPSRPPLPVLQKQAVELLEQAAIRVKQEPKYKSGNMTDHVSQFADAFDTLTREQRNKLHFALMRLQPDPA